MREILFRGKRVDNGEWVEGLPFGSIYGGSFNGAICAIRQTVEKYGDIHEVVIETVGEYTGLTDKNGKRIFEGDIVQGEAEEACGIVEWQQSEGRYLISVRNGYDWLFLDDDTWTIISNKWDNPELLED